MRCSRLFGHSLLGRNTGEVLGVFGTARIIKDHELLLPRHDDPT